MLCRWCGGTLPQGRRSFCSGGKVRATYRGVFNKHKWGCVEEWRLRRDATFLRRVVYARDGGVCAACGKQTVVGVKANAAGHLWRADHVVPIFLGGSGALTNVQTLCIDCDKVKTYCPEFRKRCAEAKRGKVSYVRTEEIRQRASEAAYKRPLPPPIPPKVCKICQLAKSGREGFMRKGRCHACAEYFRRHGVERSSILVS